MMYWLYIFSTKYPSSERSLFKTSLCNSGLTLLLSKISSILILLRVSLRSLASAICSSKTGAFLSNALKFIIRKTLKSGHFYNDC